MPTPATSRRLPAPGTRGWTCRCSGADLRLIAQATYASRPWRNGQGTSRDIASGARWQASLADIDRSGRFSDFTGSLRLFAVVAGAVVLHRPRGRPIACDAASPVVVFDGGEAPDCEIVAGPARALNLIVSAGSVTARLERVTLEPGSEVLVDSADQRHGDDGVALVFVQSGGVECRLRRRAGERRPGDAAGEQAERLERSQADATTNGSLLAGASDAVIATAAIRDESFLLRAAGRERAVVLLARIGAGDKR